MTTDSGLQCQRLICVFVYVYIRVAGGWIMPTLTDVQTDVHFVPVDSDSPTRKLLKVQTVRCALVLYKGDYIPSPAPISPSFEVQDTDFQTF